MYSDVCSRLKHPSLISYHGLEHKHVLTISLEIQSNYF